jgi:hypothetical protein
MDNPTKGMDYFPPFEHAPGSKFGPATKAKDMVALAGELPFCQPLAGN